MVKTYVLDPQCSEVQDYYAKPDRHFSTRLKWRREHQQSCRVCTAAAERHAECKAGCQS